MTTPTSRGGRGSRSRSARLALLPVAALSAVAAASQLVSAGTQDADSNPATALDHHPAARDMRSTDRVTAMLATAGFQDVATAEAAGYGSSMDTLGCFQDPTSGGMGLHYVNEGLLDDALDAAQPEALVYELGADGEPIGLVAHEYIVPIDAWTSPEPPRLFEMPLHRHPTLPLWVLHAWLWKDNPAGVFEDWNPAVRMCPAGVPIFGIDLPADS